MIYAHSRYDPSQTRFVLDRNGEPHRAVSIPDFAPINFTSTQHVVMEGERLEYIAARHYADPELWWVIAAANPENFYPENLPAGTVLRIPSVPSIR